MEGKRIGRGILTTAQGDIYEQEWNERTFDETDKGLPEELISDVRPFCKKRNPTLDLKNNSFIEHIELIPTKEDKEEDIDEPIQHRGKKLKYEFD